MKHNERRLIVSLFAWNDMLLTMLGAFMVLVAVLVTQVQEKKTAEASNEDKAAGAMSVYIFWADNAQADVDLHIVDAEDQHVYFARTQGKITNLLRDDLGMVGDTGPRNFENAYIRNLPPGNYVINIHAFSGDNLLYPLTVEVELNFISPETSGKGKGLKFTYRSALTKTGNEQTLFRFAIGHDGKLVPGSLDHLFQSIIHKG